MGEEVPKMLVQSTQKDDEEQEDTFQGDTDSKNRNTC